MSLATALNTKIFNHVHGNNLVYNICWEDPRIDHQMLNLGPDDNVPDALAGNAAVLGDFGDLERSLAKELLRALKPCRRKLLEDRPPGHELKADLRVAPRAQGG